MKLRNGAMKAVVAEDLKASTLLALIRENVTVEAEMLITDELKSYKKAAKGYTYKPVKHSETFVNGNGIYWGWVWIYWGWVWIYWVRTLKCNIPRITQRPAFGIPKAT